MRGQIPGELARGLWGPFVKCKLGQLRSHKKGRRRSSMHCCVSVPSGAPTLAQQAAGLTPVSRVWTSGLPSSQVGTHFQMENAGGEGLRVTSDQTSSPRRQQEPRVCAYLSHRPRSSPRGLPLSREAGGKEAVGGAAWQASWGCALVPLGAKSREITRSGASQDQGAEGWGQGRLCHAHQAARGGRGWAAVRGPSASRHEGGVVADVEGEPGGRDPQLTSHSPPLV